MVGEGICDRQIPENLEAVQANDHDGLGNVQAKILEVD